MKTTRLSLIAFALAGAWCLGAKAQSNVLEGYSARLSWPVVENVIAQRPEIKEFLADGDYVTYVMAYHPAAAALVRRVQPGGVLEENFEHPGLQEKALQAVTSLVDKHPHWKEALYGEANPEADRAAGDISEGEVRFRNGTVDNQDIPADIQALDEAVLRAKLTDLTRLWESAADAASRTAIEKEMRLLENALKSRRQ